MLNRLFICLGIALTVCVCPSLAQDNDFVPTSGKFQFRLRNGTQLSGFMPDKSTIELLVAGMEIKVPVPVVETVRFDDKDLSGVRVQLHNGDSLSGQIMPSQIEVTAEWGTLKINSSALAQMTRVKPPRPKTELIRPGNRTSDSTVVVPGAPPHNAGN